MNSPTRADARVSDSYRNIQRSVDELVDIALGPQCNEGVLRVLAEIGDEEWSKYMIVLRHPNRPDLLWGGSAT